MRQRLFSGEVNTTAFAGNLQGEYNRSMDDPRNLPAPEDRIERIHAFALDLAYGAVIAKDWKANFLIGSKDATQDRFVRMSEKFNEFLERKWGADYPHPTALHGFGYFDRYETVEGVTRFNITPKAMQLLEAPAVPPSVFISYARPHSSAFGLLIVARLQQIGVDNPYIDMDIDPGDKWREDIEEKISGCQYFALLISPASRKEINDGVIVELATLERPNVQHEVRLARETAATIVPIWHNGFVSEKDYPDEFQWLAELNAIRVVEENPEQYQSAVDKLRNLMGYAPR